MWSLYSSGHIHSQTVMEALAQGTGLPLHKTPCELQPGGMVTYGHYRGLKVLFDQVVSEGRNFVYIENGYFRPSNHGQKRYDGFYRVTKNAFQHDGSGRASPVRWELLGKRINTWKHGGRTVMVCPPADGDEWLTATMRTLKSVTDRPLLVRDKANPGGVTLWDALRDCHAMVTHSSNAAVESLLYGIPVFCTHPCASYMMGEPDLTRIETPRYPDREQWAWNLAANQWTIEEMKTGQCWSELWQSAPVACVI